MSSQRRILLYLYGLPNIVGSAMGLAGLLLFFTGIIKSFWLPIVIGLYLAGVLGAPRRPEQHLHLAHDLEAEQIRRALEELLNKLKGEVAPDVIERVGRIRDAILAAVPYLKDLPASDPAAFNIRQAAFDYLPETLEHYLKLPRAFARFHPLRDGKTAKELLLEQLDLLDDSLRAIVEDLTQRDTDQLRIHGRFLESKFAKAELFD